MSPALQAQDPASAPSLWQWLWDASQSKGVLETLVATLVAVALLIVWWRLSRLGDRIKNRAFLRDYFLGIEQALQGDSAGAEERLERVLAADPENHFARMLLGDVMLALARPEKAHGHHLLLRDSFEVGGARNALGLGKALLAAGRPGEAADAALAGMGRDELDREAAEFAFRARLQAGDPVGAAEVGSRLLSMRTRRQSATGSIGLDAEGALRNSIAAAFSAAGAARLAAGDRGAATQWLQRAMAAGGADSQVALLQARIEHSADLPQVAAERLLGFHAVDAGSRDIPARTDTTLPKAWLERITRLWPEGRWRCGACRASLVAEAVRCPRCGAEGKSSPDEPLLFDPVDSPDRLADALEANAAHVRRACRTALDVAVGADHHEAARRSVIELGARAVPELLPHAIGSGERSVRAVELLRELGPGCTPTLFAVAEEIEDRRILPDGGSTANAVGRVVQSYGRDALPYVRPLFASARASSRKILIDYFLGLADMEEFQSVLQRFSPVEILSRIGKADDEAMLRFLRAVEKDSFVVDVLLADPMFERDVDVFRAITGAAHPEALEQLLVRRGPSRALLTVLLEALEQDRESGPAFRILAAAGQQATDALVGALVDPERGERSRGSVAELLVRIGSPCVDRLCAYFGSEASESDDALRATLARMGDAAIDAIQEAYMRPGWVELVTIGLVGRGGHRRRQLVFALREIGTPKARVTLAGLRAREQDQDMQLTLDEALHRIGRHERGGAGGG